MKIYLTGGTGFLGSHFADLATVNGAKIVSLVRPTSNTTHLKSLGVTLNIGDLLDVKSLIVGMKDCDVVVHAASPLPGWNLPQLYEKYIVGGTKNIITAMEESSIEKLVYISTFNVYGLDPTKGKPISEEDVVGKHFLPYDYYGKAKSDAEKIVKEAHKEGKIQATVLQPGWIYGPRNNYSYGKLADSMKEGRIIKIGNGENRLPLVYVGNVSKAIWLSVTNESSKYRVYLCAYDSDKRITQNDLFESLARASNTKRKILSVSKKFLLFLSILQENISVMSGYKIPVLLSRYLIHLCGSDWDLDQRLIKKDLGYFPDVNYKQGFLMTERWYRQSRSIKTQ